MLTLLENKDMAFSKSVILRIALPVSLKPLESLPVTYVKDCWSWTIGNICSSWTRIHFQWISFQGGFPWGRWKDYFSEFFMNIPYSNHYHFLHKYYFLFKFYFKKSFPLTYRPLKKSSWEVSPDPERQNMLCTHS